MTKWGYARCSTNETKQDVHRQVRELKRMGVKDVDIYCEYASGLKNDRIELNKLLKQLEEGDEVYATEVSRLSRSTQHFVQLLGILKERKVKLIVGSLTLDFSPNGTNDPMTIAMIMMMNIFSNLEIQMTKERIKSGLRNAAAKGKKLGRPRVTMESLPDNFTKHLPLYQNGQINKTEFASLIGVSRKCLYHYLDICNTT